MAGSLDSALAKVARAEEHLGRLQEEIGRWREKCGDRMARDNNDERTEFRWYTQWDVDPDGVRWALLLGDGIHNLRSALDHAVYACSGPRPPARCEFPIFLDRTKFFRPVSDESGGLYKIRGIKDPVIRALIEGAQPWQNPRRPKYHWFWIVHELDIQDKHRLITPVVMTPRDLRGGIGGELIGGGRAIVHISGPGRVPLENHALLMTVRTPKPARWMEVDASLDLGIGVEVADSEMGISSVLRETCKATRGLIEQIRDAVS
ncbi:MAG TPA: hypothetical protein VFW95_07975 [Candidatus Limnocylindria bacterium]|nr:hypothetical protein [Candidatus Limnocylindria bacterium]